MNILFDINHPVDVNCFKNSIKILSREGHRVIVTYRPRGKLRTIINSELGEFTPVQIGKHYSIFIMKIIGQLYRDICFLSFNKRNKIDLSVGTSTNVISSWLLGIPHLAFEDDIEYKIPFYHANFFATRHIMPSCIDFKGKKVYHYKGLKELAYLHPDYFFPRLEGLQKFDVEPDKYIFIRKVANVSLNYRKKDNLTLAVIHKIRELGFKILLSLEEKRMENAYRDNCIILEEPLKDIFSLMNYALFTISSGDSVARESCLLGTPTIYTGGREMLVNRELIEAGCMFREDTVEEIVERINFLSKVEVKQKVKKLVRIKIENEWDNTTEIILKHIKDFEK